MKKPTKYIMIIFEKILKLLKNRKKPNISVIKNKSKNLSITIIEKPSV